MKTLVVVDMQNDFIYGSLGSLAGQIIVPDVANRIAKAIEDGDRIIFTRDTHLDDYLSTPEGIKLPVEHCILNNESFNGYIVNFAFAFKML
jgi:nicotinamidase-related amidase